MSSISEPRDPKPERAGSTLIRLEGADVLPLLHRISTQALTDLEPGHARTTLFCDFRGRLLHRAAVVVTSDHTVWLLRDDAPGDELAAFVDRHVFREDVKISEPDPEFQVRAVTERIEPAVGTIRERDGRPEVVALASDFALLVAPGQTIDADEVETARIRAGRPRHGHEIAEAFNPFEIGVAHELHLSKGCFTGQEVLMRLITYRSVRRRLGLLRGEGKPPRVPSPVSRDATDFGVLTSAVSVDAGWIGLAVLRHAAFEEDARVEVEGRPSEPPHAFPETRPLGIA